jgi:glycerate 2-kinase
VLPPAARVLVAPDKFKGTLDARAAALAIAQGISSVLPDAQVRRLPIADGGEGTVAAAVAAGAARVVHSVTGPRGARVDAEMALFDDGTAVIETAAASGLALVDVSVESSLASSSFGTGELILRALDAGARRIVVGLGGSAMTDGGSGALRALGAEVTDSDGRPLPWGGGALTSARRLDVSGLDPRLREARLVFACDVDSPLVAPNGAAAVFGPQKGADDAAIAHLDRGLRRWADLLGEVTGVDVDVAGAGAAGGFPAAFLGAAQAEITSGFDVVAGLTGLMEHVASADLVITGEGSLDAQSLAGKGPVGVARIGTAAGVPVAAVAGVITLSPEDLKGAGFAIAVAMSDIAPSIRDAVSEPTRYAREAAARVVQHWGVTG